MSLSNLAPLPDDLTAIITSGMGLCDWIAKRQDDLEIKRHDATLIPGTLFDLTIEHHVAIVHLTSARINGSAFALLRAAFETLVRSCWLQLCATPEEVEAFKEREHLPGYFGTLIEAVEKCDGFGDGLFSKLKTDSWKAMNSYTHGGMLHVGRRIKGGTIQPNYEPGEVIEVLKASGTFALIALKQIAQLAKNEKLVAEVEVKLTNPVD